MESIHRSFRVLAIQPPASFEQIVSLQCRFRLPPEDYLKLVSRATEIELQHERGQYVRIWGPAGCIDMDEGYGITERILGAFPVGDDGGGNVLLYMCGNCGPGLYLVGYGDLNAEDATFVAPNLTDFLCDAVGVEVFY
jgi:hypothetical protein